MEINTSPHPPAQMPADEHAIYIDATAFVDMLSKLNSCPSDDLVFQWLKGDDRPDRMNRLLDKVWVRLHAENGTEGRLLVFSDDYCWTTETAKVTQASFDLFDHHLGGFCETLASRFGVSYRLAMILGGTGLEGTSQRPTDKICLIYWKKDEARDTADTWPSAA